MSLALVALAVDGAILCGEELVHELVDTGVVILRGPAQQQLRHRPLAFLDRLPLERLAYVHVAGGTIRHDVYLDTHAHPVPGPVLSLVQELTARCPRTWVMLERDQDHPPEAELHAELEAIAVAQRTGAARAG